MKIKTGDKVRVTAGKDKGKEGTVLQVFPELGRAVVEDINMMTRHLRAQGKQGTTGQKIRFPAPIHASNLMLVSPKSGTAGRVGYKFIDKDGKREKVRVLKAKGKAEEVE